MSHTLRTLLLFVGASSLHFVMADVNIMKDVTLGFGQALDKCREESQLTEEKMEEFFHFWGKDFKFEHREVGCAIRCMSQHFNLLTDSNRMHHQNTENFIKSFPNGEVLAKQMVEMIHSCEKQYDTEPDHCWRILRIAECFKKSCQNAGIAPSVQVIVAEFIMESEPN